MQDVRECRGDARGCRFCIPLHPLASSCTPCISLHAHCNPPRIPLHPQCISLHPLYPSTSPCSPLCPPAPPCIPCTSPAPLALPCTPLHPCLFICLFVKDNLLSPFYCLPFPYQIYIFEKFQVQALVAAFR